MTPNLTSASAGQATPLQVVAARMDAFKRLERSFNACGWNLYPLHDDVMLAVHRRYQTSQVCHSPGQAASLLKRAGGAA